VAQWNRLDDPGRIRVGQMLRVTPPEGEPPVQVGAARGAGAVSSRPIESRPLDSGAPKSSTVAAAPAGATNTTKTEPKALRLPYSSENLALLQKSDAGQPAPSDSKPATAEATPAAAKAASQAAAQPAPAPAQTATKPAAEAREADGIEFIWPARGKILTGFAEPTSKGVDIGGKPGDPVVAAAPGRVIYIGSGIRGYGKLIVIKHDNNFNSVYAHNREILVKQDQTVARGQKIAELGATDADAPKLHFEIRKSGKPVDPVKYLPSAPPS
jgi:lipoprotein NlpD